MAENKCKICRRVGTKLFLKGDRCFSQKCALVRRSYPPGQKGKRRRRNVSEYAKELQEKQKLKRWYHLREKQFRNYVQEVLEKRGQIEDTGAFLIKKLESRLDNVVFRMGFAPSRIQARQLVSHGHFLVNGRKTDVPSYQIKKGDVISLKDKSRKRDVFKNLSVILKKKTPPSWLKISASKMEGEVVGEPSLEEVSPPAEISAIFEFYSR